MSKLKTPEEMVADVHSRLKPVVDMTMADASRRKHVFLKTVLGGYALGLGDAFQELAFKLGSEQVTEEQGAQYLDNYLEQLRTLETFIDGLLGPEPGETK